MTRKAKRRLLVALLFLAPAVVFSFFQLQLYLRNVERIVRDKFDGKRWDIPSKIYSDSLLLYPGADIQVDWLAAKVRRLGYKPLHGPTIRRGEFSHRQTDVLEIYPQGGPQGSSVILRFDSGLLKSITRENGEEIGLLELEPELISGLYSGIWEERKVVSVQQVPPLLVSAILSVEDERFFQHHGVDLQSLLRAVFRNILHFRIVEGGSTLTQQLMKNFFLGSERTFKRKITEAVMALVAERLYSKTEILTNYLNEIYFGQKGSQGIFGVWEASKFYFSKEPPELNVSEMATLAGLIKAPNHYSLYRDPLLAAKRRNVVLGKMLDQGLISKAQFDRAVQDRLLPREFHQQRNDAPYFIDFVRSNLNKKYSPETLTGEGLKIHTTLDVRLQKMAEDSLSEGLTRLEQEYPKLTKKDHARLQGAIVVMQPHTGEVRAMVGGRNYQQSQFNRVFQAKRQAGSVFKPFVYLAALGHNSDSHPRGFQPNSILDDAPFVWAYDNRKWSPENYDGEYFGRVTFRRALEKSLNGATARLAKEIGISKVTATASRLGITSPLPQLPSIALGAVEVTPLEIATAFSTLANNGLRPRPLFIKTILDKNDNTIERRTVQWERVLPPQTAFLMNHLLEGVLDRGTGASARRYGFTRPAAGKTGTTNEYNDAWFVGYTPDLLAVVWVGFDQGERLGLTGAQAALPIWVDFMKKATERTPVTDFTPPPGISFVTIDAGTGQLATPYCPNVLREVFLEGTEPKTFCSQHFFPWPGEARVR